MAPHCLKFWVATRHRFSTPHRDSLIQILSIQTRIFSHRGAAHLKLTTPAPPANACATVCSISGPHSRPIGSRVSSTNPQVSARYRKLVRLPCDTLTWKKDALR
ncbi:hypothetical protein TRVL_04188 [Trypanosoma vivax]|nr:hypothetical protein TRVL_04188 [Trypanosoma vivax]